MRFPNNNDFITVTKKEFVSEGMELNLLPPSKIMVKEKTDEYIILESSDGIAEISEDGRISLLNAPKEIKINKGESKDLTLPVTDYFHSVTIKY